jgi:hypothetical protein
MVTHFSVREAIHAKIFFLSDGQFADYFVFFSFDGRSGLKPHKISTEPDILLVSRVEIAFGEADIVDSVKDIGLAHAIIAYETIDFFRKSEVKLFVVFEISKVDGPEEQSKYELSPNLVQ